MALPEVSSLGDLEPAVMSSSSAHPRDMFSSRTCAMVPRTMAHSIRPPTLLYRHVPPCRVITSPIRTPCSERIPRLLRCPLPPPPPPPPPPLPGHVMRLFVTRTTCASGLNATTSIASTAARPVRFPRMGHTGLATNGTAGTHRTTLYAVRPPGHCQL